MIGSGFSYCSVVFCGSYKFKLFSCLKIYLNSKDFLYYLLAGLFRSDFILCIAPETLTKKNLVWSLCALIGVFIFSLIIVSPASASTGDYYSATSPGSRAQVRFYPYGEHLKVYDLKQDGYYAWADFIRYDTNADNLYRSGSTTDFNLSIPEGTTVKFRACYGNSNVPNFSTGCSSWIYAVA